MNIFPATDIRERNLSTVEQPKWRQKIDSYIGNCELVIKSMKNCLQDPLEEKPKLKNMGG